MNLYVYKMTVDNGGAPCVRDGLLSLAICKPVIRRVAKKGSVIFGFAGNAMGANGYLDNRLIYVAEVKDRVKGTEYYMNRYGYKLRPDQIYKWNGNSFERRTSAQYHPEEANLEHDLGSHADQYPNSCVLVSDTFCYFGSDGPLPPENSIKDLLASLAQGHRCNLSEDTVEALLAFKVEAFSTRWASKRQSETNQTATASSRCSADEGVATDDPELDGCNQTVSKASHLQRCT